MQRYAQFLIIAFVLGLDQLTKALVVRHVPYLGEIKVTSFFSIVHGRNYGGLFGFLSNHEAGRYIFLILPLIIIGFLIYYVFFYRMTLSRRIALTFVLAGAIGNVYDRVVQGYVTDFLDFFYGTHHWPAFNVADMAINFGIGLWLCVELLSSRKSAVTGSKATGG
ncbi:MAG TPA: signal peptidase II [Deltaproteobacteria bacterium]|nr:signal peptidase II [Deltaproteobacteria bacterium]